MLWIMADLTIYIAGRDLASQRATVLRVRLILRCTSRRERLAAAAGSRIDGGGRGCAGLLDQVVMAV